MVQTGIVIQASPWDWVKDVNPFAYLAGKAAGEAGKVVAGGWTAAMLGLWNAGLWLLQLVLNFMDAFLVPDLSENGPGSQVYQTTFWIAGALVGLMTLVQLGTAAIRRDGRSLATVAIGTVQFVGVWFGGITYGVAVVAACGGLTRALMSSLLHVDAWSLWHPWKEISTKNITDGTVATVLGVMGIFVILAAFGHFLVLLARGGALIVLAATTPISAAGLVADAGKAWFWKSLRWFHAAALTPVLMILVLGIGVKMAGGVATGLTDSTQKSIGTALPSVVLICIGVFSPLALFKLLAFVDPGTSSGAGMRAGLAAMGGISGLFGGKASGSSNGGADAGSAASTSDEDGKSQGESSSEDEATGRFQKMLGGLGPGLGQAASKALGGMQNMGSKGASIGTDLTNQMGVGHNTHQPDFSTAKKNKGSSGKSNNNSDSSKTGSDNDGGQDDNTQPPTGPTPPPSTGPQGNSGDDSTPQSPTGTNDQGGKDPISEGINGQTTLPPTGSTPITKDGAPADGSSGGNSPGGGSGPGAGEGGAAAGGGGGAAAVPVA